MSLYKFRIIIIIIIIIYQIKASDLSTSNHAAQLNKVAEIAYVGKYQPYNFWHNEDYNYRPTS